MSASDDIRILQKQVYDLQTSYFAPITGVLGINIALNNINAYFDGPSVMPGTVGTWYVSGEVTLTDSAGAAQFYISLHDDTTIINSSIASVHSIYNNTSVSLSGFKIKPVGNFTISVMDISSASGFMVWNSTGLGKDSTITTFRIG